MKGLSGCVLKYEQYILRYISLFNGNDSASDLEEIFVLSESGY